MTTYYPKANDLVIIASGFYRGRVGKVIETNLPYSVLVENERGRRSWQSWRDLKKHTPR